MHQKKKMTKKTTVIFSTFGIFGVMLAFFLIFNLSDIPKKKLSGPNLVKNSGFEKWINNILLGWEVNNVKLIQEKDYKTEGGYSVGIYADNKETAVIEQSLTLNPMEIYNICFSMKSNTLKPEMSGVEIIYEGEDVKTTTDASPGTHYHESGSEWQHYFGRVTGASNVTIRFFAKNNAITFVDDVKVGVNALPDKLPSSTPEKLN